MKKLFLHGFYTDCKLVQSGFARPSDFTTVATWSGTTMLFCNIGLKKAQLDNLAEIRIMMYGNLGEDNFWGTRY